MKLSIIIPVYNAEHTIGSVCSQLIEVFHHKTPIDIILVNDGSNDRSLTQCMRLSKKYRFIKTIDLTKNFGQHNAMMAGLRFAKSTHVLFMDDDLQTSPVECYKLFIYMKKHDVDVVYAQYAKMESGFFRRCGSRLNSIMASILMKKPQGIEFTSFFIINDLVRRAVIQYEGPYVYFPGLITRVTRKIAGVPVKHVKRTIGTSNYTLGTLIRLWTNGFTNFSILPLRCIAIIGFILFVIGCIISLYLVLLKTMKPDIIIGWTSLAFVILLFGGLNLMFTGIVGEYIGRMFLHVNKEPQAIVRKTYNI